MTMFVGQMIMGWGLFNLVEGVVDHHLLQIHHVRDLRFHIPAYDFLFSLSPASASWQPVSPCHAAVGHC